MLAIELADYLVSSAASLSRLLAVTGFDGFVDEMLAVVQERHDLDRYDRVERIERFAELVAAAAGRNSLREIVVTATHPGGCAVNMGDALAAAGVAVETFATLGEPIHSAFGDYGKVAALHSWGREPGRTLAFEFADGKLMLSAVSQLAEFTPATVEVYLQAGTFATACERANLIAITDWTLFPHMTSVWRLLQQRVFAQLRHQPWFFVDLVDPASRAEKDIREMLEVLPRFASMGRVVLGLNQNEANLLAPLLSTGAVASGFAAAVATQASALRSALEIEQVVIHTHRHAVAATHDGAWRLDVPHCAQPKKSTGAGDRFNAGYAVGLMLDLAPEDCLLLGTASGGFFVRHARSATRADLVEFLRARAPQLQPVAG